MVKWQRTGGAEEQRGGGAEEQRNRTPHQIRTFPSAPFPLCAFALARRGIWTQSAVRVGRNLCESALAAHESAAPAAEQAAPFID